MTRFTGTRIFMGLSDASRRRQHSYAGDFASLTAEVKPPIYRWAEGQAITAEPGTLVAPESLSSMTLVRTHSIHANDLQFEVDEAGEGDDVALLLHGFPESRRCWRHQLPMFVQQGWRVVAPDMRGYGGSSRPKERGAYHVDHLVADAAALFDSLGARRPVLIGHDWGGIVAWAFAIRQARPLAGLGGPQRAAPGRLRPRHPHELEAAPAVLVRGLFPASVATRIFAQRRTCKDGRACAATDRPKS